MDELSDLEGKVLLAFESGLVETVGVARDRPGLNVIDDLTRRGHLNFGFRRLLSS